jgi:phage-related minor tail protein
MSDGLEDIGDNAEVAGKKTSIFADVLKAELLSDVIMSGIRLLVDALKDLAGATVGFALDSEKSLNDLQAQTGATEAEMEQLKDTMNAIYADNFGNDISDVANSMALVKQQTDLSGDALKDMTEQALLMRDTFDFDVAESVRAVDMLMNQFGISSEEAYNLIAQGAQNGLNKNNDLLDTINEYSVYFADAGLSADSMFNSLVNGAESGTFSVDKLGDAMKEFSIRAIDGSDTTKDAFQSLGFDVDDIAHKFADGGQTAEQAFADITNRLFMIGDPIEQNRIGVELFGTQWEDLGAKGVQALSDLDGSISTTSTAL